MRQAIVTKYFGPTNHRGSRIRASCDAKSIIVPWDHALDTQENHKRAAHKLAESLGWTRYGEYIGGGLPGNAGYCFVQSESLRARGKVTESNQSSTSSTGSEE